MSDRRLAIERFLATEGWSWTAARPLAGDASFRTYWRLAADGRRAVLMDAPPPHEDIRPFSRVARHLKGLDFSAPTILAEDVDAGLLLLEDLGDGTFSRLLDAGADEAVLYGLATDVLIDLHRRPAAAAIPDGVPPYDDGRLLDEASLFTDWYLPAVTGAPAPAAMRAAYVDAWRAVLPAVQAAPRTLVLRDFHVDNLMSLPDREGVAACGLLDFQDAVAGPAAYDLMSLLEDARRDVHPALRDAMLARYRRAMPELDAVAFAAVFAILAAQRHAKVIGIFTRLARRDGKPAYSVHIPRVWRLLERALLHPALRPVRHWFDRHVPPEIRVTPSQRSFPS